MDNPITFILSIIEQPAAKKTYEDLWNHLKSTNRQEEADGIYFLIRTKFENVSDNSHPSQE
jgi:hypothetical protein